MAYVCFDMNGFKCELAVNIYGDKYYVEGTDIDDYGDAHSDEGFCNAIRDAKIQGQIVDDKYIVSYFKLIDN